MATSGVTVVRDNMAVLLRSLRILSETSVMIGVPATDEGPPQGAAPLGPNERTDPAGKPEPINNATLGYIHETGAPGANIPARPHLVPGVKSVQNQIARRLLDAGEAAMAGNAGAVDRNLHAVGLIGQSAVRNYIAAGVPPPLAASTVRARRQRTQGSSYRRQATSAADTTPLIDTGAYLHSISYIIRRRR